MSNNNFVLYEDEIYNFDVLVNYMDDNIREHVHFEMAPCTNEAFLSRYLELDHNFAENIEMFLNKVNT